MNTHHSPAETRSSINAPYPQFGWQGAVCEQSQILLQPAVTRGLNRQHFHTGPWLGRDWREKEKGKKKKAEMPKFLYKHSLLFQERAGRGYIYVVSSQTFPSFLVLEYQPWQTQSCRTHPSSLTCSLQSLSSIRVEDP